MYYFLAGKNTFHSENHLPDRPCIEAYKTRQHSEASSNIEEKVDAHFTNTHTDTHKHTHTHTHMHTRY